MSTDRVLEMSALPRNVDAERSVLASIVLDGSLYSEAAQLLSPDDFSLSSHRIIFRSLGDMVADCVGIDPLTLEEQLARSKQLETVGGSDYILSLTEGAVPRASIKHHAAIVKRTAQLRGLIFAAEGAIASAQTGDEPSAVAASLLEAVMSVEAGTRNGHLVTPCEFMPEVLRELEFQSESGRVGFTTGIPPLDAAIGGYRPGEVVTLGAASGTGKTAFACQTVAENAKAGVRCGVFSFEMSRWDLGRRFLAAETSVTASKIRHPRYIGRHEWQTLANGAVDIGQWPVWVDDSGGITLRELMARARMMVSRMKVQLLIVDYLHLVKAPGDSKREEVANVADGLRQLAKAEQVPILALSQLRRPSNASDKPPTMFDLKKSGEIENHSHVVLLIHAPSASNVPTGEDSIIIGKNRNGPKGEIPVTFNPHRLRFYQRET